MLDDHTRAHLHREIERAVRPRGMSVHDGRAHIDASVLQRLLAVIDAQPAPRMPEPMTDGELNNVSIRLRDDLLDHIYEYSTTAEGVRNKVLTLCRAIEAETLRRVKEANK